LVFDLSEHDCERLGVIGGAMCHRGKGVIPKCSGQSSLAGQPAGWLQIGQAPPAGSAS
jgi:hypothetical protein